MGSELSFKGTPFFIRRQMIENLIKLLHRNFSHKNFSGDGPRVKDAVFDVAAIQRITGFATEVVETLIAGSPSIKCPIANEKLALAGYDFPAQYEQLCKSHFSNKDDSIRICFYSSRAACIVQSSLCKKYR